MENRFRVIPKKARYIYLFSLLLLAYFLRYPSGNHETGLDSFFVHSLARSVISEGRPTWIIHPLSYMGLTPDAYPTSVPMLLASLSLLSGMNMEVTILVFNLLMTCMMPVVGYILGKEITVSQSGGLLSSFFFITVPVYVYYTHWTITTRTPFILILPLLYMILLRSVNGRNIDVKYLLVGAFTVYLLLTVHRMGLFLPGLIFAFAIAVFLRKNVITSKRRIYRQDSAPAWISLSIIFTFTGALMAQVFGVGLYKSFSSIYASGVLNTGTSPKSILINLAVDYVSRNGTLFFFAIYSLLLFLFSDFLRRSPFRALRNKIRKKPKDYSCHQVEVFLKIMKTLPQGIRESLSFPPDLVRRYETKPTISVLFFLITLTVFSTVIVMGRYTSLFLIPVLVSFATFGVLMVADKKWLFLILLLGSWTVYLAGGFYLPQHLPATGFIIFITSASVIGSYLPSEEKIKWENWMKMRLPELPLLRPLESRGIRFSSLSLPFLFISLGVITVSFSMFMVDHWMAPKPYFHFEQTIDDNSINTIHYMNDMETHRYLINDPVTEPRLQAYWLHPKNYKVENFSIVGTGSILDVIFYDQYLILYRGGNQEYKRPFQLSDVDDGAAPYLLSIHEADYIIISRLNSTTVRVGELWGGEVESGFVKSVPLKRYSIFDSGRERIYFLRWTESELLAANPDMRR